MGIALRSTLVKQIPYRIEDVFEAFSAILPQMDGYQLEDVQPVTHSFRVKRKTTFTRSGSIIRITLSLKDGNNVNVEMIATPIVPTQLFDIGDSMTKSMELIFERLSSELEKYQQTVASIDNTTNSKDVVAQLRDLASLREEGILTEEEFAAKKKQLLNL
ncbi:SHOCT domain-containing protein [Dysosmobacter sp.]|uniref:SHOCT domain-containing protein n=1 Tax=Dysosmobacter sp. TaxID=2591382 RepID=UPI002621C0DE|nr:SHOCT domain-containing protein [Dysosmobacter sp.]